jgi:hypothetical protein
MAQLTRVAGGSGENGSGGATVSATVASYSRETNDLAVAMVAANQSGGNFSWPADPSGWVLVEEGSSATDSFVSIETAIFRATSTAVSATTFTANVDQEKAAMIVEVFRGADTSATPVTYGTVTSGADASVNSPQGTSPGADGTMIHCVAIEGIRTVTSNTSGFTAGPVISSSGGGGDSSKITGAEEYDLASPWTDPMAMNLSASANFRGVVIGIKPVAASPQTVVANFMAASTTIFAPTVPIVAVPLIAPATTLFEAFVVQGNPTVFVQFIGPTNVLFTPTVTGGAAVLAPRMQVIIVI